uniref:Thyroglobulin type-1 domain-containing protein n=1 Tax=Strigamia maritima TaxID=126957 RepID=T1JMB7_STRMM
SYIPSCDEHGYYQATQCSHATVELCWCVDKHGVEYANTRMKGKPDCDSIVGKNSSDDDSEDEDSSDDESLMEGSADQPLDI